MNFNTQILGKALLTLLLGFFAFQLLTMPMPWILIDNLNLGIHEAGHLIFSPFGMFAGILGGSLFQILFPCFFFIYFFMRKELPGIAFSVFWISDNIINVSVYMRDAIPMQLPLVGGDEVIHDWNWLFSSLNLLNSSEAIASSFYYIGVVGVVGSIVFLLLLISFDLLRS